MTPAKNLGFLRLLGFGVVLALSVLLASGIGLAQETSGTYINPVSKTFADTFADPAVIKAKDGYWYAYGTSDPLKEGEGQFHTIPIARSTDLVNWEHVGDVFSSPSEVELAAENAGIWAPDIRYIDGTYYLYYGVTETTATPETGDSAIGVATAPTPTGPWTDSEEPVVGPRRGGSGNPNDFLWTFDSTEFTDKDGTRYLYFGSYYGGIHVTRLSEDGKHAVGRQTMVAIDNRYEGPYVIRHGRFYYLFASSANCCAGPTTGYSVYVGRAKSPRGPFLDREGQAMTESRVGGSIVITPNGNKWVGPGHNAIATDLSGQNWFVYHAIDWNDPYLDEPFGINERPMLLDRLDWINGWPTVRGGRWASESAQPAPVTKGPVNDSFNRRTSLGRAWNSEGGAWRLVKNRGMGYARQQGASARKAFLVNRAAVPRSARVEGDLRFGAKGRAAGIVVRYKNRDNYAVAWLDRAARALVTDAVVKGKSTGRKRSPLPSSFVFSQWHNVAVEVRGAKMSVEVTDARLHDPYAVVNRSLPRTLSGGKAGVASRGRADADNVSAARLYTPNTQTAPTPRVGGISEAHSDEFNGDSSLEPAWEWVHDCQPEGEKTAGVYRWPVQEADLTGNTDDDCNDPKVIDTASVLLREAPQGDYVVETELKINLGVDDIRNYQQGGLVAYLNDDHFLRLSHVAIWNTRQTEFGKEMPFVDGLSYGGMLIGPPDETTYLRLSHRVDPSNGEHEFRAATSRDGQRWVWGGTWTLPAGANPRIGLISHGKQTDAPTATSEFDYFRVYRP